MKHKTKLITTITILLLSGCGEEPKPTAPPKPVFKAYIDLPDENWPPKDNNVTKLIDLSDLTSATNTEEIPQTGKTKIYGTIYLTSPNGAIITGAYSNIYLRNTISSQNKIVLGNQMLSTISDNMGKFEFNKIPNGKYKLSGNMNCGVECGYDTNKTITLGSMILADKNVTYNISLSNKKSK